MRSLLDKLLQPKYHPQSYDSDLIHSLCLSRTYQYERALPIGASLSNLIDMKYSETRFNQARDGWLRYLNVWATAGANIKIQNHVVSGVLSYVHSEFLTDEIEKQHTNEYNYRTK